MIIFCVLGHPVFQTKDGSNTEFRWKGCLRCSTIRKWQGKYNPQSTLLKCDKIHTCLQLKNFESFNTWQILLIRCNQSFLAVKESLAECWKSGIKSERTLGSGKSVVRITKCWLHLYESPYIFQYAGLGQWSTSNCEVILGATTSLSRSP